MMQSGTCGWRELYSHSARLRTSLSGSRHSTATCGQFDEDRRNHQTLDPIRLSSSKMGLRATPHEPTQDSTVVSTSLRHVPMRWQEDNFMNVGNQKPRWLFEQQRFVLISNFWNESTITFGHRWSALSFGCPDHSIFSSWDRREEGVFHVEQLKKN